MAYGNLSLLDCRHFPETVSWVCMDFGWPKLTIPVHLMVLLKKRTICSESKGKGKNISLYTEHISTDPISNISCQGRGTFTSPLLSAYYYYSGKKDLYDSGAITCELIRAEGAHDYVLRGIFAEIKKIGSAEKNDIDLVTQEKYVLVSVDMPVRRQWPRFFEKKYFKTIEEIQEFVANLPGHKKRSLE